MKRLFSNCSVGALVYFFVLRLRKDFDNLFRLFTNKKKRSFYF